MENPTIHLYSNATADTLNTSAGQDVLPSSSDSSSATIKPLPSTPHIPRSHANEQQPYHDDPPTPLDESPASRHHDPPRYHRQARHALRFQPYADSPPPTPDADDVPLARLLFTTHSRTHSIEAAYPSEAPPPYAIAVRESYRDTLIQYIPRGRRDSRDVDEESAVDWDMARPDDVRYSVEKVVAMLVVAMVLLVVAAVLAWLALGSGVVV